MKLDKQLKKLIRDADMTVAQLGRASGVSAKTIYNWLQGQAPRDIQQVKYIADHFNVSLDFLCYGTEIKKTNPIEDHQQEILAGIFEVVLRRPKNFKD